MIALIQPGVAGQNHPRVQWLRHNAQIANATCLHAQSIIPALLLPV
jgi:hypothetical protein